MVCLTWQSPGEEAGIEHHSTCEARIADWLQHDLLIGANVAYDMAVVAERFPNLRPLIFKAYDEDRVTDVQIRQRLLDIAAGVYRGRCVGKGKFIPYEYSLEAIARRCAGMQLQKDGWRLSYGYFIDTPIEQWVERARVVQEEAKPRLAALEARLAIETDDKALKKEVEGLREMIASAPEQCIIYPKDDARATLAAYLAQEQHAKYLGDEYRQGRAAFGLHLESTWGLKTDEESVDILRAWIKANIAQLEDELVEAALVRIDKKGKSSRDTKAAKRRMMHVCARDGLTLRRTDGHSESDTKCKNAAGELLPSGDEHEDLRDRECAEHVALDREACEATEDEILVAYAELSTDKKVLSNDIAALDKGTRWPIHTRFGLAETGRSTSSKPNIQNWARGRKCRECVKGRTAGGEKCKPCGGSGTLDGAREAFVPRPGKVFAQNDYPQLELYTLAQCCVKWVGFSKLAELLNAGLDPHLAVAAQICRLSYEEAKAIYKDKSHARFKEVKNARDTAKVLNFGFPGGLGVDSTIEFAKKGYGVVFAEDIDRAKKRVKELKDVWFATLPEMPHYFARVNVLCDNDANRAFVETLFTQRFRGNATYCAACNNGFQALGADCAKCAAWRIARAQYVGTPSLWWSERNPDTLSPLFNGRAVAFIHDEFISEVADDERAHDAAWEQADLMREAANQYLVDVPIARAKMEPLLMRRWSKKAEPRVDTNGRLVPWVA